MIDSIFGEVINLRSGREEEREEEEEGGREEEEEGGDIK